MWVWNFLIYSPLTSNRSLIKHGVPAMFLIQWLYLALKHIVLWSSNVCFPARNQYIEVCIHGSTKNQIAAVMILKLITRKVYKRYQLCCSEAETKTIFNYLLVFFNVLNTVWFLRVPWTQWQMLQFSLKDAATKAYNILGGVDGEWWLCWRWVTCWRACKVSPVVLWYKEPNCVEQTAVLQCSSHAQTMSSAVQQQASGDLQNVSS